MDKPKRRPTFTRVDWDVICTALAYHEAAGYGEDEVDPAGIDPPDGFRSWAEHRKRADKTREKVWDMLERTHSGRRV